MFDEELSASRLKVCVAGKCREPLHEAVVRGGRIGVCSRAGVVECSKNTRRTALFDEVAHDLVVEVLDRRPLDLLANVFLLFTLESQLDEDLLQLLVDVVDAELLKGIVLPKSRDYVRTNCQVLYSNTHLENLPEELDSFANGLEWWIIEPT